MTAERCEELSKHYLALAHSLVSERSVLGCIRGVGSASALIVGEADAGWEFVKVACSGRWG